MALTRHPDGHEGLAEGETSDGASTQPLYDGPMVDAHHHFWDPTRNLHPWLAPGVSIPFRYGNYDSIKDPYLPDDLRRDSAGHHLSESVYVETEWDSADPLGETRYAASLAARHGWPHAIVAQAWLDRDDVAEVLAGQAAESLVRSVRHKPGGPERPDKVGATWTLMSDEIWRRGYALLERHGLHFDLQTPWWNLDEAARLADDFPRTTIVLNHAGLPADRSDAALLAWRAHIERFAARPNTAIKISGLGLQGRPWSVDENRRVVEEAIVAFGPARAMFASNFPVDRLCGTYDAIMTGFKRIVAGRPAAEQAALFCDTARRIYRTGPRA
jgi:predicted TIM-barrel fold metal-dependent hydrolase